MKRSLIFGVVIGLVFSLTLPFHSMAANLSVQTSDGFTIIVDKPILGTYIDASGNQIVLVNSPHDQLPLQQFEPMITISGASANNGTAIVTGTKNNAVIFNIFATDTSGTPILSYLGPIITGETPFVPDPANPSAPNMGQFSKAYNAAGTYQVVFGAVTNQVDSTQRSIAIVITDPQACTSTVTASVTNPAGGSINAPASVTTTCGSPVSFSGTIASGYTSATVTEGSFAPSGLTWNWTGVMTPATNGATKNVSIMFTGSTSCNSSVTATIVGGVGGSITSTNPVTTTCGSAVSFSGTFASGYTSATVTEGSFSAGSPWSWTGVTAPAANGGSKTVSITFSTSTPPPGGWLSLNNRIGSTSFFGYNYVLGGADFQAVGGTAYQFLIDPIAAGATTSGKPLLSVADRNQTYACMSITLSVLDANNNKIASITMLGGNASYNSIYPKNFVYTGQRLLLEFTPGHSMPMLIYWSMN